VAGAFGDTMFTRLVIVAAALAVSPSAFAQESSAADTLQNEPLPLFYSSLGLAWSGELGLELEAGLQWELEPALRFRLSPINLSLFDGDIPDGFFWDDDGFDRECRDVDTGNITFDDECSPEPDAEWRSVAEAQLRVAPGIHFGGGVTYMLQGDFSPEGARLAPFASLAWDMGEGMGIELRGGEEYMALQLRGVW
jgi:hypothetical protein